jgi:hypothetical protein
MHCFHVPGTCTYEQSPVDPIVSLIARFKPRMRPHVISFRRDCLPTGHGIEHVFGTISIAEIDDLDGSTVVRFKSITRIKFSKPVRKYRLPIGTDFENVTFEQGTGHQAADNWNNPTLTSAAISHFPDRVQFNSQIADMFQFRLREIHFDELSVCN